MAVETDLISLWLEPNHHMPSPAEWRIKGTGLTFWRVLGQLALELGADAPEAYRELSLGTASSGLLAAVAAYYDIDPAAVRAALAYAHRHADPLVACLILDRAAFAR